MSRRACSCSAKSAIWPLGVFVVALSALMLIRSGAAPTPEAFDEALTLPAALEQAQSSQRPVFVLATADWCPPCQSLKRGAMTDERVVAAIRERTIPVYLDASEPESPGAADAARLGVSALPTMLIIRDGQVTSTIVGAQSADRLLSWLDSAAGE